MFFFGETKLTPSCALRRFLACNLLTNDFIHLMYLRFFYFVNEFLSNIILESFILILLVVWSHRGWVAWVWASFFCFSDIYCVLEVTILSWVVYISSTSSRLTATHTSQLLLILCQRINKLIINVNDFIYEMFCMFKSFLRHLMRLFQYF